MLHVALEAATRLEAEGVQAEVLDLRTPGAARSGRDPGIGREDQPGAACSTRRSRTGGDRRRAGARSSPRTLSSISTGRSSHRLGWTRRCPTARRSKRPSCPTWRRSSPRSRRSLVRLLTERPHMATDVVMPQMGESIAEGTIVRWLKKVGDNGRAGPAAVRDLDRQGRRRDPVARPPASLTEIQIKEGRDRPGQPGGGPDRRGGRRSAAAPPAAAAPASFAPRPRWASLTRRPTPASPPKPEPRRSATPDDEDGSEASDETAQPRTSCAVRDRLRWCAGSRASTMSTSSKSTGTGISGRVTKQRHPGLHRRPERSPHAARGAPAGAPRRSAAQPGRPSGLASSVEIVPMSMMRRKIAEHMVLSAHTSPHVYSVYEIELRTPRPAARQEEGGVRARRQQAHLHRAHRQGDRRRAPRRSRSSTPRSTATTSSTRRTSTSASPWPSTGG